MAMLNNQMVIELMVLGINLMVGWLMIQLAGRLYQGLEHAWWTNDSVLVTWVFTSKSKLSWLSLMCMPASENRSFWMEKWLIPQFPSISQFFGALHSLCIDGQYCIKPVLQVWTSEFQSFRQVTLASIRFLSTLVWDKLIYHCIAFFFVIFAGHHHKNGGRHFGF